MIKIISLASVAVLCAGVVFAGEKGDHSCCVKGASNKMACADFASMNLTAEQKTKLEAWQADCVKGGCTTESRTAFLKKAEGILSVDQFAKLKKQCQPPGKEKTQT